jgi:hypothetical protein
MYRGEEQVGFARAVTDYATLAYPADVFVLEGYGFAELARSEIFMEIHTPYR